MSCLYKSNWADSGKCELWDDTIEMPGCDNEGNCICDNDPDPSYLCGDYESDYKCSDCGVDLNIGDCECEE